MISKAQHPDEYAASLPEDRRESINKLRETIKNNLPEGFEEVMSYGMIGYVVPHKIYPPGYHCNPELPLPFINLASQKNYIAFYHMGIYAHPELLNWFVTSYPNHTDARLDMGKSCIRFKKPEHIPYKLLGKLCGKMSVDQWIEIYESQVKR